MKIFVEDAGDAMQMRARQALSQRSISEWLVLRKLDCPHGAVRNGAKLLVVW
jgi:hypothetical protein